MYFPNDSSPYCNFDIFEQWKRGHLRVVTKFLVSTSKVNSLEQKNILGVTEDSNCSRFSSDSLSTTQAALSELDFPEDVILELIENEDFALLHNIILSFYLSFNVALNLPDLKDRTKKPTGTTKTNTKIDNESDESNTKLTNRKSKMNDQDSSTFQLKDTDGKSLKSLICPDMYLKGTIEHSMAILCDKVVVANYNLALFLVLKEKYELAYLILNKLMLELKYDADNHRIAINTGFLMIHILNRQGSPDLNEKILEVVDLMEFIISTHKKKQDSIRYKGDQMFICLLRAQLLLKERKVDLFTQHLPYLLESFFKWINSLNHGNGNEGGGGVSGDSNIFLSINLLSLKQKKNILDTRKIIINLTNFANKIKHLSVPLQTRPVKVLIYLIISNILDFYQTNDKAQQKLNDIAIDSNFTNENLTTIYNNFGVLSARQHHYALSSWYFFKSLESNSKFNREFIEKWKQNGFSLELLDSSTSVLLPIKNKIELLNNLGINFYNLKQYEKAYNCFDKVLSLNKSLCDSNLQVISIIRHAESAIQFYLAYLKKIKPKIPICSVLRNGGIVSICNHTLSNEWRRFFSRIQNNLRYLSTFLENNDWANTIIENSSYYKQKNFNYYGRNIRFSVGDGNDVVEKEIVYSQFAHIHAILSWISLEMEDFCEADTEASLAIDWLSQISNKSQTELFRLRLYQSEARLKLERLEDAEKIVSNLLQMFENPNSERMEYRERGKRVKSEKRGSAAFQLPVEYKASLYCSFALVYIKKKNWAQVKKFINKSLEINPNFPPAIALRIYLAFSSGKSQTALKFLCRYRIQCFKLSTFQ